MRAALALHVFLTTDTAEITEYFRMEVGERLPIEVQNLSRQMKAFDTAGSVESYNNYHLKGKIHNSMPLCFAACPGIWPS